MMAVHRLTIPTGGGRLAAALHLPEAGQRPWPCVVTAHGLLSSKDSDKYVQIGEVFTQAGIAVCRFDFRGCGESQGNLAETTLAQRVADLRAVVEMMRTHPALSGRVALLGSSLGGYAALFAANRDFKVKAVAAWATPANLDDLAEHPEMVRAQGLGDAFIAELKEGRYLRAPVGTRYCLFVHGEQDELVPADHARRLAETALNPRHLEVIPGADHRFTDATHRQQAVRLSLDWIGRYL
jgi:fermentation-respiration switch protein FrsA (DUF1100 family)